MRHRTGGTYRFIATAADTGLSSSFPDGCTVQIVKPPGLHGVSSGLVEGGMDAWIQGTSLVTGKTYTNVCRRASLHRMLTRSKAQKIQQGQYHTMTYDMKDGDRVVGCVSQVHHPREHCRLRWVYQIGLGARPEKVDERDTLRDCLFEFDKVVKANQ